MEYNTFCAFYIQPPILNKIIQMENKTLLSVLIFCFIVFIYLHITYQWKTGEDLEIYEVNINSHSQLQEICEVRQPVLFHLGGNQVKTFNQQIQPPFLDKYNHLDVKVKDIYEYQNPTTKTVEPITLSYSSAKSLTEKDPNQRYISENNSEFIQESSFKNVYSQLDTYLRPHFCAFHHYDILFGSRNAHTPLKYHTHSHYFLTVSSGKIHVKLAQRKSKKYLQYQTDYENLEFYSPINIWNPQHTDLESLEKIKFLELDISPGQFLYVPPYWWYSIQYSNHPSTIVCEFRYNTLMNVLANSYDWTSHLLQRHNIHLYDKEIEKETETTNALIQTETQTQTQTQTYQTITDNSISTPFTSITPQLQPNTNIEKSHTMNTENELGQREGIPLPPSTKKEIMTNSGVYYV